MKTFRRTIALLMGLVMIVSFLAACDSQGKDGNGTQSGEDTSPIKIGAVVGLTGAQSAFGQELLTGYQMATKEINEAGGVLGRPIELYYEDDGSQAAQSATAATKLITKNNVIAMLSPNGSACALAMLEVVNEYEIPFLVPGASSPLVTNSGSKWVNRTVRSDDINAEALVAYASSKLGAKTIGFMYSNDDLGKGGYNYAVPAAEKHGVTLVAETFQADDQNFTTQLNKLRDADCEAVIMWCMYTPGALICKQMAEMNWVVPRLASAGVQNIVTFELSNNAVDGLIMTGTYYPGDPDPRTSAWTEKVKNEYGYVPTQATANAYDSMMLLCDTIKKVGTTDPATVQAALRQTKDWPSLKGPMTINTENGEFICEVRLLEANAEVKDFTYIDTLILE